MDIEEFRKQMDIEDHNENHADGEHDKKQDGKKHHAGKRAHFGPHQIGKNPDHFREKLIKEIFEKFVKLELSIEYVAATLLQPQHCCK